MGKRNIERAYEILDTFNGENPYIKMMKRQYDRGGKVLNEFEVDYIVNNYDYVPTEPMHTVNITNELGERLYEKYNLDFVPKKIRIERVIGEMGDSLHCYVRYRQSLAPMLMFVSRKGILGNVEKIDWKNYEVDFTLFDEKLGKLDPPRKLKKHQCEGVKFILANGKRGCILADSMGTGKTTTSLVAALASGVEKILVITTASLKTNWKREAEFFIDSKDISIVNGSNWVTGNKITITNYDVVKNFYTVAEVQVTEPYEVKDSEGNVVEILQKPVFVKKNGKLVPKMKKSRNKEEIKEALENSPFFKENFGFVILDEAHLLSNKKTIRTKTISDFLNKRSKIEGTYTVLVTGTPMTGTPVKLYNLLSMINAEVCKDYNYFMTRFANQREINKRDGTVVRVFGEPQNLDELREKISDCYIRRLPSDVGDMVDKFTEVLYYEMTDEERNEYNSLWQDYLDAQEGLNVNLEKKDYDTMWDEYEDTSDKEKYRQLIEGSLLRQYLSKIAVPHTIEFVEEQIADEKDKKIVIITCFKKEMAALAEYFGNKCVCYPGGLPQKKQDEIVNSFKKDKQIFIGNIGCCCVGLNLDCSNTLIFNSISFDAMQIAQASERIHRLSSTQDANIYISLFVNSFSEEMYEKVLKKQMMADTVIKSENQKEGKE